MTPPERAADALPQGSGPQSVAQTGAATEHRAAPVPQPTAGAGSRVFAAPAVAPLTAGALNPESGAPAVSHGAWAAALTGEKAHWVPEGAPQKVHEGRPTGLTLEGWYALIDELGLAEGAELPPCRTCCRELARMSAPSEPTQP